MQTYEADSLQIRVLAQEADPRLGIHMQSFGADPHPGIRARLVEADSLRIRVPAQGADPLGDLHSPI